MAETDAAEQISFQTGLPPYVRELALQIQVPPTKELDTLPFTNLEPRNFERLCLRLIERETDVHGHATLYGRSGQKQHGIDVFAQRRDTKEYWVYQSKRYEHYDPSKLNEAVRMFVRNWQVTKGEEPSFVGIKPLPVKKQKPGTTTTPEDTESKAYTPPAWFKEIKKFVVCVTVDFGTDKDLGDAKTELSQMLNDLGLQLEVWHAEVINQKLKNLPEIVEEFFGVDGVKRFCPESVSTVYLAGMNARALLTIKRPSWNAKVKTLSPAELLVSRNRIVPFAGREPELEHLRAWCNTDSSFDVLAYTGAGGTGKTRLLLEYCLELQSKGWIAGFVDNIRRSKNPEAWDLLLKDDLLKQNRPVLIVMDYAENRSEELTPLLQAIQETLNERELPVRLVLIARGIGEWYEQLRNNDGAKSLLPGNKPESNPKLEEIKLSSPTTLKTPQAITQEFFRVAEKFAATRDKTIPEEIPVDLSADLFQRVLFVHMAALLAVETGERIRDVSQAGILERVLELETNYWAKRLNNRAFIPGLLRTMTLVTFGYPVQNLEDATQLLTLDEDFRALTTLEKKALANILHDTYPGEQFINPVEPNLIAEHLVFTELTNSETGAKLIDTAFGRARNSGKELEQIRDMFEKTRNGIDIKTITYEYKEISTNGTILVDPETACTVLLRLEKWHLKINLLEKILKGREHNRTSLFSSDILLQTRMRLKVKFITAENEALIMDLNSKIEPLRLITESYLMNLLKIALKRDTEFNERFKEIFEAFDPLIDYVFSIAIGYNKNLEIINNLLITIDELGFHLRDAVHRIWADERDFMILTVGLNEESSAIINRILVLILINQLEQVAPPDHP